MVISYGLVGGIMRWVVFFTLLGVAKGVLAAQLVLYDFSGASGSEASFGPAFQPGDGFASNISRGVGLGASSASDAFSARNWSTTSFDQEDYFGFSIRPDDGFKMALMTLEFDERRSASGISQWSVRSSLDGFTVDLSPGQVSVPDNTETRVDQSISFDLGAFSDLRDEVELRIFGFDAEGGSGTWRIDNVELFGEITPVPELDTWVSGVFMGVLAAVCGRLNKLARARNSRCPPA